MQVDDEQVIAWLESEAPGELDLPIDTLEHRIWHCPALDTERQQQGSNSMKAHAKG